MSVLRTHRLLGLLLVLVPFAAPAQAAPASKKPPPPPTSSSPEHAPAHAKEGAKETAKHAPKVAQHKGTVKPGKHLDHVLHKSTAHLTPVSAPHRAPPGKSVGSPTEGHLVGGSHLADAPHLRIYPSYSGGDVRWGVEPLVALVDRAGKSVRKQFPDAVLSVGHLSKAGGGELDRHASHESGRDADIGFYVKNTAGKPIYGDHMVAFIGDGTAPKWPGAHFDDARNWSLVSALVGDGHARVTHIFVATPIRERLLAYATKIGASPAMRNRAAEVLAQPHGALPHDDHFHVRIACPSGMEACVEQPTARAHRKHHGAIASHGHPAHPHGAHAAGGHASAGHPHASHASAPTPAAAPAHGASHPAAGAPAAKPAPAPAPASKPEAREAKKDEETHTESMPSLAPVIPGLDSAVIPAPLTGVRSTWGTAKDPAPPAPPPLPAPKGEPISDPDGVLDHN